MKYTIFKNQNYVMFIIKINIYLYYENLRVNEFLLFTKNPDQGLLPREFLCVNVDTSVKIII